MYGVLQGGTISPTLFNAYIDDMQNFFANQPGINIGVMKINHLLQADDLILLSETSNGLQRLWNKLAKYCHKWHPILNVTKTKIMFFNKKFQVIPATHPLAFNGVVIEECIRYKYLGVIFTNQGHRFNGHFEYLKDNMTSIMHVWQRRTWLLPTTSDLPL